MKSVFLECRLREAIHDLEPFGVVEVPRPLAYWKDELGKIAAAFTDSGEKNLGS